MNEGPTFIVQFVQFYCRVEIKRKRNFNFNLSSSVDAILKIAIGLAFAVKSHCPLLIVTYLLINI